MTILCISFKFLNLHELDLLNLKFILVCKVKFSSKFNYIDFIFKRSLQAQNELRDFFLAREAGFKLVSGWTCFVRPNLSFKFHVLISVDEKITHYRF